ncbi:MAG: sensor histidine kinase [Traorella sp.]
MHIVFYAFGICSFIGLSAALFDYYHFLKLHHMLVDLQKRTMLSIQELPSCKNQTEEDYQKLIEKIFLDKINIITKKDKQYDDLVDYYTLWAHQIKTPIAALHLLLNEQQLNDCEEELFKIEQYVDMVLTYLKVDHQGTDLKISSIDIDECIKKSIRKYAKLFIRKKLQLNYDSKHVIILSDEKWLCFIIEQLLSNAIKYTPQGSVNIRVENDILTIQDSGIGIQEEDIPRVFEKGFTGYNGRCDSKSTGIGLYLVKKMCHKLGHKIWIESVVGEYTKVMIDLKRYPLEVE